ncbi:MAG: tetratricopeptide repeat protein [Planctomycetota bacterium]
MASSLGGSLRRVLEALRVGDDLERLGHLIRRRLGDLSPASLPQGPPRSLPQLDELLEHADPRLDLGYAASLLAWEDAPHAVDVPRVVARIRVLGATLRAQLGGRTTPEAQLEVANRLLFDVLGWEPAASRETKRGENRLGDLLLPYVLERGRGHCVGLSVAYLAVTQSAGLPVFGVSVPGHFFVRYDDGRQPPVNVEVTARGASLPDAHYVQRFQIPEALVERGVYLQNLSTREVLSEVLNNRANVYWDRGDPERAARDLDRVTRVSHGFSRARLGRGFMAKVRGDYARARRELEGALAIEPGLARAELLLGEIHLERGELEQAHERFHRAAEGLDHPRALTTLGRVESRRADYAAAIRWHLRATQADPGCHVAWNNLGVARLALGLRSEALKAFEKARQLAPEFLPAAENLLHARRRGGPVGFGSRGAFRWICRRYEEAIQAAPRNQRLRGRYVRFLLECGAREEVASRVAREGLAPEPTVRALETLALVRRKQGQGAEAARLLRQALELDRAQGGLDQARLSGLVAAAQAGTAPEAPRS